MNKYALITGGSTGLGYAISEYFAKAQYHLIWVSKDEKELQEAKQRLQQEFESCVVHTMMIDLSLADSAKKVFDWVFENNWQVEVLVNNAGFGNYGFVNDQNIEKEVDVIKVNLVNTYKMSRYFLEGMLEQNKGTIINISSLSSVEPTPKLTVYGSTKAFVTHFTRGLTEELKLMKSNVRAICICPAAIINTPFKAVNNMGHVKMFDGLATTTVEEVAKDVWYAFTKKKSYLISGKKARRIYKLIKLLPYSLIQQIIQRETTN